MYEILTFIEREEDARDLFSDLIQREKKYGELWGIGPVRPATSFREHFGLGIRYGYPLCCVLKFSLKNGRGKGWKDKSFKKCGIFHKERNE